MSGSLRSRGAALVRFAMGGVLSSSVVLGVTALLREGGIAGERVAAAVGLASALVVNFHVMRRFVFRGTERPLLRQALEFLAGSGVFRGLEYLGFLVLHTAFDVHYLVALVLVLGTSFGLKFVVYEGWVFRRER
jgi:putative flippase GtrA